MPDVINNPPDFTTLAASSGNNRIISANKLATIKSTGPSIPSKRLFCPTDTISSVVFKRTFISALSTATGSKSYA